MGTLYLVPTPIGNLEDITLRAIKVLQEADLILAEDTRTSGKLLKHYEIGTPMQSHHMHNEHKIIGQAIGETQGRRYYCPDLRCRDPRYFGPRIPAYPRLR